MTDHRTHKQDSADVLDDLFALAQDVGRESMPETLVDRITQDAILARRTPVEVNAHSSLWARLEEALGGWPTFSGLATAAVAGLYVGFADPALLQSLGFEGATETVADFLPGDELFFDLTLSEEG